MRKSIVLLLAVLLFTSFAPETNYFVGRILYKSSFADLKGNDITAQVAPIIGTEQHYYSDGKNYKALNERDEWMQLFQAATNTYYNFGPQKTVQKQDANTAESQKVTVTKLDKKEKIMSYECSVIQIDADNTTTVYYYNAAIKADTRAYSKHAFGEWKQYMEATDGALPLKFVITDNKNGFSWTATAIDLTKMKLTEKDFVFPEGYTLVK